MGTTNWNIYNIIDALLYHHVKRHDIDKNQDYNYYPFRKRFRETYKSGYFEINVDYDVYKLRNIISE